MPCERLAMGPLLQSDIESVVAVRLLGLQKRAERTESRVDASHRGRDAFPTDDSTWRRMS